MSHQDRAEAPQGSRFQRLVKKAWWLHSCWALVFGIGVMFYARAGLKYAQSILLVLGLSWLVMFVALRFIVGPANRKPDERLARKGVRVVTNYIIKNLYQQMFFFLVPLYASSATWSFESLNWWLPPVLLAFAVLSTMDLVFDNFIMERRWIASLMYGLALFGVLNLMLPLTLGVDHFVALLAAAAATAPAVALLNWPLRTVFTGRGLGLTFVGTLVLISGAWFGRALIPPAPMALVDVSVGHGTPGSYECLPGVKTMMLSNQLDGLRCGAIVTEPGGLNDDVHIVWKRDGTTVFRDEKPVEFRDCGGGSDGAMYSSVFPQRKLPPDSSGDWVCRIETADGQLIGLISFDVEEPSKGTMDVGVSKVAPSDAKPEQLTPSAPSPSDAGSDPDRGQE